MVEPCRAAVWTQLVNNSDCQHYVGHLTATLVVVMFDHHSNGHLEVSTSFFITSLVRFLKNVYLSEQIAKTLCELYKSSNSHYFQKKNKKYRFFLSQITLLVGLNINKKNRTYWIQLKKNLNSERKGKRILKTWNIKNLDYSVKRYVPDIYF